MNEIPIEVYALSPLQSWLLVAGLAYLTYRGIKWFVSNKL
jgi:hypothetical protein